MAAKKPVESKVFVSVATASGSRGAGKSDMSKRIEAAMIAAIEGQHAKGITDPDKVRAAILKARETVKTVVAKETRAAEREAKKATNA